MTCTTDNCKYPAKMYINTNKDELIVFVLLIQLRIILSDTLDGKLKAQYFKHYVTSNFISYAISPKVPLLQRC